MPVKLSGLSSRGSSVSVSHDAAESAEKVQGASSTFSAELMAKQGGGVSREQLDALMKQIDEQAARLSKTPTYDELKEYRTLIKNFVGEAVSHMYALHSQSGWDRMGRQRIYTTVRKVDRKLEEMAEKIRLGHSEQLDVIASHDAIRGMLIDLYM